VEQQLLVLSGAVSLVLLTIAANMSSLLLAHGEKRRRELAVRGALGASRASLVRQLLAEGWILAALGGILGGCLAWVSIGPIVEAYPAALPRAREVQLDWRTAGVGLAASLVIGTLVAWLPGVRLTGASADGLRAAGRGIQLSGIRLQRVLVVSELAMCVCAWP
jgi:putative ABC transport system permease protein